jgi:hypothetical protein
LNAEQLLRRGRLTFEPPSARQPECEEGIEEEYNPLTEMEREIILAVNPCANEHLFILTIDALKRGSDYDNQFIVFFSANT